ncbi:uncharacterized protein [Vicugna pacos]|uniref:Uncharacterized protein n=1 Tax=Vicugna pacos TaxID=30538 RepID=A0ABM5BIH2_VICPA
MSHFINWKVSQVSKSSLPCDNVREELKLSRDVTTLCFFRWANLKVPKQKHVLFSEPLVQRDTRQIPDATFVASSIRPKRTAPSEAKAMHTGGSHGLGPESQRVSLILSARESDSRKGKRSVQGRKRAMCKDLTARRFSPRPPGTDWKLPTPLGPVYPPSISGQTSTKAVGRSWELSLPTAKSFRIHDAHLPQQGPFRHFMDMKAEKRLAGRKERRSRFGDINVHKCYQFGQVFCPFQVLATTLNSIHWNLGQMFSLIGRSHSFLNFKIICVASHADAQA